MNGPAKRPRVSVGVPVYNGENFLAQALDGLLAQTFSDFEIIISDNASTDRTGEISRAYSARDPRIAYARNETNIGLAANHNRVVDLATGDFFMWHAHDDLAAPGYLARCIEVLDRRPDVVVCFAENRDIDAQGDPFRGDNPHRRGTIQAGALAVDSPAAEVRFRDLIRLDHQCEPVYGVMRLDVLRRTPRHAKYPDADRVLLAELALHGPFHLIPEPLFFHREHDERSVRVLPDRQDRVGLLDPAMVGKMAFPHWREFRELWATIRRAPVPDGTRARCRAAWARWAVKYRGRLAYDLASAARTLLRQAMPEPVRRAIRRVRSGSSRR